MIIHLTYFAPIIHYIAIVNTGEILFETEDNYQKQTYRNRCYIYGANGKLMLNIPIIHSGNEKRKKYKDVKIDSSFYWQKLHIKSLQTAYRSSPYFEFYEDDLLNLLNKKFDSLMDLNYETYQLVLGWLQLDLSYNNTETYRAEYKSTRDLRYLVNAKDKQVYNFQKYHQVFDGKYGFVSNLSILDLLFNEGPNSIQYLENHKNLLY